MQRFPPGFPEEIGPFTFPYDIDEKINTILNAYSDKLKTNLLPPDPARWLAEIGTISSEVEHILPIPPVIETLHAMATADVWERFPRLKAVGAFLKHQYLHYPETIADRTKLEQYGAKAPPGR